MVHDALVGKVCIVTGATRGIGLAASDILANYGATVIMVGRDEKLLDIAASNINNKFPEPRAFVSCCDVTSEGQVKLLFQEIFKAYKRLDVLVANAGILDDALIGMVTHTQIEKVFSVNTFALLYCSQYASRLMARNGGGSIVNISSIIGTNGNVGQAVYGGSKAAVLGITKSLAKELAPNGIRVNAIAPGFIDTDMARSLPEDKFRERIASIKMNRIGTPLDVARVILFLSTELSSYVTGQTIGVDGGMLI